MNREDQTTFEFFPIYWEFENTGFFVFKWLPSIISISAH